VRGLVRKSLKNKKGFTLVEIIVGLAILGILSVVFLSLFTTAYFIIGSSDIKTDLKFDGEKIIENLKAYVPGNNDPIIMDTPASVIVNTLQISDTYILSEPDDYNVIIVKEDAGDKLWKIRLTATSERYTRPENQEIIITFYMPIPK